MMNQQEAFDLAWKTVIAQGKPSRNEETSMCQIRGDGGTKCALGALISDEDYSIHLEEWTAKKVAKKFRLNEFFLSNMQEAHDNASAFRNVESFVEGFKWRMKRVAETYGLVVPYDVTNT